MQSISKLALEICGENITKNNSFALRVERTGIHNYSSQDVAIQIGSDIVNKIKSKVNLTNPDFELFIEIRDKNVYMYTEKIRCVGGFPISTQGNVIVLVNDFESILAAWYMMKRGCKPIFLLKNSTIKSKLNSFINQWYTKETVIIDSKKFSDKDINGYAKEKKCIALITGHNLLENSKNILSDIKLLKKNINIPVFHPLIAIEPEEINKKCKEIGLIE